MPLKPPGSDWDVNGCITSAGYSWCDILGRCIRAWEQSCDYPQNCLSWFDGCNTCSLVEGEESVQRCIASLKKLLIVVFLNPKFQLNLGYRILQL